MTLPVLRPAFQRTVMGPNAGFVWKHSVTPSSLSQAGMPSPYST
jgi:hypothetical protein